MDYQKMYVTMAQATERAIQTLITAQQAAEEIYMNSADPELVILETDTD